MDRPKLSPLSIISQSRFRPTPLRSGSRRLVRRVWVLDPALPPELMTSKSNWFNDAGQVSSQIVTCVG